MFNPSREPAAYAEVARLVIAALVAVGWITIDNTAVDTVLTAAGAILSIFLTATVRANVTPVVTVPPVVDGTAPQQ